MFALDALLFRAGGEVLEEVNADKRLLPTPHEPNWCIYILMSILKDIFYKVGSDIEVHITKNVFLFISRHISIFGIIPLTF